MTTPGAGVQPPGPTDGGGAPEPGGEGPVPLAAPAVSLPKGGGAIKGIGEKFAANPVTGTGSMTIPIETSAGRSGFGPRLELTYDSGAGNGPFGFGWTLTVPSIVRKTDLGVPRYQDAEESDAFILWGAEDLVPVLDEDGERVQGQTIDPDYVVHRYRPRVEGAFARIERWTRRADGDTHWRSIDRDNVLTLYGKDPGSRIADPEDRTRVFRWLICEMRDDKGNAVVYDYKPEDGAGVDLALSHERNRGGRADPRRRANRYLKRVRYGNRTPLLDGGGQRPRRLSEAQIAGASWMFEVVFDYGEHDNDAPTPEEVTPWSRRIDPFSSYRAGFEVRTTRICRRVLGFHDLPDEPEVGADCLVRSTDFTYAGQPDPAGGARPVYSLLAEVTQSGYRRQHGGYVKRSVPSLEFEYSAPVVDTALHDLDAESLENLPVGIDGTTYTWVDLHGEGLPGILTEQGGAWYYKRNLSPLHGDAIVFGPTSAVADKPNLELTARKARFADLTGAGRVDVVVLDGPVPGVYEHEDVGESWLPFRAFTTPLNRDFRDTDLRLVDLDGDGRADVLLSEDDAFVWHRSLGVDGFGPAQRFPQTPNEEDGPRLVFSNVREALYFADVSGDGLPDLVRVRNGECCYWPNIGHRFGAKVTMDRAPWFDRPDAFDIARLRLADIDGSGTADLIYLHRNGARLYFNHSGNGWSDASEVPVTPADGELGSAQVADLHGNGTACLVWSSALPGDASRALRYVDLMSGIKPHLLVRLANNLGGETLIGYASSTKFFLQDRRDGRPWITRLPFPVHVVERVETVDHTARTRFMTQFAYHHGFFDGIEREFRGFGMVEQWDTERIGALGDGDPEDVPYVPPVLTRSWFHTGEFMGRTQLSAAFADEYFRPTDSTELLLPDTVIPAGLSPAEEREACRALKGAMLHQELYADDGSPAAATPYTVTEQSFAVRLLQPRGPNRHAAFFSHGSERIEIHYERDPSDPRVRHTLTLEVDAFGHVLKEAVVAYGRRAALGGRVAGLAAADHAHQTTPLVTYNESGVTNPVESADVHRTPLPAEVTMFELTGYAPTGPGGRFLPTDFVEHDPATPGRLRHRFVDEVPYEVPPTANACRRAIKRMRTLYRRDDCAGPLALGQLESLALTGENYKLAFTPGLLAQAFQRPRAGRPPEALLPDPASVLGAAGGYVRSQELKTDGRFPADDPDDTWWIPTGRVFFTPDPADDPAAELAHARQHFFLGRRYRDPFGQEAVVDFDGYDLLLAATRDALGNHVRVDVNDYRVLQPRLVSDPNGNRTEVAFDALGLVAGTAVMGKPTPAPAEGDSLDGFVADLTTAQVDSFVDAADPHTCAAALLQEASTRIVYDLDRYRRTGQPPCTATLARETHARDAVLAEGVRIQIGFTYADGIGREIQKKVQAEPGPVADGGAIADPRWVGTGWVVLNNKGNPVRRYEPFFSATHGFEFGVAVGVSPVLFYDPAQRVIATLHPNHTYEKVVFDPWQQTTYDVNDTCAPRNAQTGDPRTDPDVAGFVSSYFAAQPPGWQTWFEERAGGGLGADEQAAATRAAAHADTPTTAHLDVLARPFLTVTRNRVVCPGHDADGHEESLLARVERDIEGNERAVRDADQQGDDPLGRILARFVYDMLSNRVHQLAMEAGARWVLNDALGKPIRAWDSRGHDFTTTYDALRRPVDQTVRGTSADSDPRTVDREVVFARNEYGEGIAGAEALNLRTRAYRQFDPAGIVISARLDVDGDPVEAYDFKGNQLASTRQLVTDYRGLVDWAASPQLEDDAFESRTRYDALNRTVQSIAPHSGASPLTVIQSVYNQANLLERLDIWLDRPGPPDGVLDPAAEAPSPVGVAGIDYDAKGRRLSLTLKNDVVTRYRYDPATFRLTDLYTRRGGAFTDDCDNPSPPPTTIAAPEVPPPGTPCGVQNLHYTYDAAGNITHVRDDAQQVLFFRNKRVEPNNDYTYDALYQLIQATGREHLGQGTPHSPSDAGRVGLPNAGAGGLFGPNDGNAMGTYVARYVYDIAGNVLRMRHRGSDPANPGWTRAYDYAEPSLIEDGTAGTALKASNRLSRTTINAGGPQPLVEPYAHDVHGNVVRMPHLGGGQAGSNLHWDPRDQLRQADLGGGGVAYFTYDARGQRARKVWEKAPGLVEERIYVGSFEVFRRHGGPIGAGSVAFERQTLHVTCGTQRVALVETRTLDTAGNDPAPVRLIRYQIANQVASSSLELDEQARIISYEEYAPYGSSTYQGVRSQTETPKRFRFTGRERDEETGFYYHGARYYACWLARWTSPDPLGLKGGTNAYVYCENSPAIYLDPLGLDEWCGLSDGFFGLFDSDCHIAPEVSGSIKAVGGGLETAGGAVMFVGGAATCEIGVGCFVAAAGVGVMAHGVDTVQSGVRTAINGEQVDSFTSLGLQELGMSRTAANLTDAGISIVGSLGASAATRAPAAATAVTEGGAQTVPTITLALRPALGPGHNYIAVTTADGVTTWSHLAVGGATRTSGVVTGGTAFVEGLETAEMGGRLARSVTVSVPVSASQAEAALVTVNKAIQATEASGQAGLGAYALTTNSCSTYAASVMNSARIATPAITSPAINFGAAALRSPTVATAVSAGGATTNTVVGLTSFSTPAQSTSTPTLLQGPSASLPASYPGVPNPADYTTFEEFSAAVSGPYSSDFIVQQWAAVRGWQSQ